MLYLNFRANLPIGRTICDAIIGGLDPAGRYQAVAAEDGVIRSAVLTGFWVRTQWFADEHRPSKKAALAEILAARE